ncbi:MAG TPA: sodium-dependent transporter, partial [Deltaproteobacteria bacterium]|nr:sodium-dependent transporter [Deltaproteobacteria bacterium]
GVHRYAAQAKPKIDAARGEKHPFHPETRYIRRLAGMNNTREHWGSRLGVILAVAGSAIGLGNFLRFPVKAAMYGGGAFLIPYFIAFVLLGIPLAWVEWTLGRFGGRYNHGSAPGILNAVVRRPWAKYAGSIGVLGPTLIFFYYVYIQSWLLGFAWYSLTGELLRAVYDDRVSAFFGNYISLKATVVGGVPASLFFFLLTFVINFSVVAFGVRRGIEVLNRFAMPVIVVLGLVLFVRVLTIPGIERGMAFMWNPDFSRLSEPRVWLEASGQMFFTLSIGIGALLTYASYVKRRQDILMSSLSACAANEFAEVILGGTIVIPMAIVVYGAANIQEIASMGNLGLGFNTMPVIFGKMPLASLLQSIWFSLLFFAGVTSSISVLQPAISFFEDEAGLCRSRAVGITAAVCFVMSLLAVFGLEAGAVDELDFWGGTLLLVLFGTLEAIVFAWIFGASRGWEELHAGASIRLPAFFRLILRWVTPLYLIVLLGAWLATDFGKAILLDGIDPAQQVVFLGATMAKTSFIWLVRGLLLALLLALNLYIHIIWKRNRIDERLAAADKAGVNNA